MRQAIDKLPEGPIRAKVTMNFKPQPAGPVAGPEELEALLNSGRPMLVAAIGIGGLAILLWLMMFKPF